MAGISRTERIWTDYIDKHGVKRFVMTSSQDRKTYFLYGLSNGSFIKLGKDKSPIKLEERFQVDEKLRNPND